MASAVLGVVSGVAEHGLHRANGMFLSTGHEAKERRFT